MYCVAIINRNEQWNNWDFIQVNVTLQTISGDHFAS